MTTPNPQPRRTAVRTRMIYTLSILLVTLATVLVFMLQQNIAERKMEARQVTFQVVELDETTVDPAEWGKNFPRQYDTYLRTADWYTTKYGGYMGEGSESLPAEKIKADPRLPIIFNGYAFAIDYRVRRGHAYMLEDQRTTKRVTERAQPGSCIHCHASNTVAYRKLGIEKGAPGSLDDPFLSDTAQAQLMKGFEETCRMPYAQATTLVEHPVSCIDCHDPSSMRLRVTRPGLILGIAALAQSDDPLPHLPSVQRWREGDRATPYDPNALASRQEMRSLTCAQCHVEYYCGPKTTLFFPWNNGLKVEQIEAYYNSYTFPDGHRFFDWKHATTGAEVIKAQHPEFEVWSQGIHARSGVSCADCHMPYMRQGAVKISNHHVASPLLDVSRSCQTCHRFPEEEIHARVEAIQDRTHKLLLRAEDTVVQLISDIAAARKAGLTEDRLAPLVFELQRKAQWRVDFINAENSMGFHAPQEVARILGEAIDFARQGQLELRQLAPDVPYIDSTKPPLQAPQP